MPFVDYLQYLSSQMIASRAIPRPPSLQWPRGGGLSRKRCALVGIIVGKRSRHGVDAAGTSGPTAHVASPRIRALKA